MFRRDLIGLGLLGCLAACGFHPVYDRSGALGNKTVLPELRAISVAVIPDRPGQLLRQALQDRFDGPDDDTPKLYELSVDYGMSGEGIGINPDSSPSRIRFVGRASWTLRAKNGGRSVVTTGSTRAMDDYNPYDQQLFSNDLNAEAVQRRLALTVADQITLQLAAFFDNRPAPDKS
jgi:LPS-assembly lipoprotein